MDCTDDSLIAYVSNHCISESAILTPKRTEYGKAIRKQYESGEIEESRHNMIELAPRTDGISNTLTTVLKDNLLLEVKKLGNIYGFDGGNYAGNVYDQNGIAPTIRTCQGGNQQPMIICLNTKGDNDKQPQQQDRVYSTNGVMTAITAELGGRFNILEEQSINQAGNLEEDGNFKNPQRGRVYTTDGISPSLNGLDSVNNTPKVIEPIHDEKQCMICAMRGRNPDDPSDRTPGMPTEQRLEPNSRGICNCLTTVTKDNLVLEKRVLEYVYRIRKLTPKECWRLMSYKDDDFNKAKEVNSASQLYKEAGNGIVRVVLMAVFSQLNIQGIPSWNEMALNEKEDMAKVQKA